ncbi:MAG: response regulator [Acetobacteraceae bacterium]|nr:response regulator [Acetobacteraceae bacterium]
MPSEQRRILVDDDNPASQCLIETLLRRNQQQVSGMTNGAEAVRGLMTIPYDLLLLDVHMPEMDGIEATQAIRAANGPIRKVPITALADDALSGDRERFIAAGMDDYLPKPIDPKALAALIEWLCALPRPRSRRRQWHTPAKHR